MAATPVLISVDEYLKTAYRPDRDYIDGEVRERNLGERPHSKLQAFLIGYFLAHATEWKIDPLPEQRVQVAATRYRIPDICLVPADSDEGLVIRNPPLLCIEIISREDTMNDILERTDDYRRMGVPCSWIINPWRGVAHHVNRNGVLTPQESRLSVPDSPIFVAVAELFAVLDHLRS